VGIALRWNGSGWTSVPIPQPSPIMLFGVAAFGAQRRVDGRAHLPRRSALDPAGPAQNGAAWTRATIPAFPSGGQLRDVVALSPTNVYAVGLDGEGFNAESLVLHWNGVSWTKQATPTPPVGPKLYGAAAIGLSTAGGVGYRYDQRLAANQTFTIRTTNGRRRGRRLTPRSEG